MTKQQIRERYETHFGKKPDEAIVDWVYRLLIAGEDDLVPDSMKEDW